MKNNKGRTGKSKKGFPESYYNWEMQIKEKDSTDKDESKIGISTSAFKEYLKAWKKKWTEPEKE